jgi:preprotein translocase subunit SecE
MGKDKAASMGFLQQLFQLGVYKRNQGRVTRQVTLAAMAISFLLAAWRLYAYWPSLPEWWLGLFPGEVAGLARYACASLLLLAGLWVSYRVVNFPKFADFLIAVEAEMNKVSWPSQGELVRSSIVVIFVILALAALLFAYDLFWQFIFKNVLRIM